MLIVLHMACMSLCAMYGMLAELASLNCDNCGQCIPLCVVNLLVCHLCLLLSGCYDCMAFYWVMSYQ